jgi:hypothetical protein
MAKNKFFAFFHTEEQFKRFALDYMKAHPEFLRPYNNELRQMSRVFQLDISSMALGRMGFREKRFAQFDEHMNDILNEYLDLWNEDLKDDEEMVYSRDRFERELKQYMGKMYIPENERYK